MVKYTPEQKIITFWSKVTITSNDDLCWEWKGGITDGYGQFASVNGDRRTHRIAWAYPNYIIPKGMCICHSCDNRLCCNPKHLFIGTYQDNMDDMVKKGRTPKGKGINRQAKRRKISKELELEIIERYKKGDISQKKLAEEYKIAENHVVRLVRYKY